MDHNRRSSFSISEQRKLSKQSRHSISTSQSQSDKNSNNIYDAIIKDPAKRALVLQLLSQEKVAIKDYMQKNGLLKNTPKKKKKVLHCESPTVLHRRRAIEHMHKGSKESPSSGSTSDSSSSSPLPFEKLLEGVVAYVEVKTRDGDRSEAVKSVIRAMGATVRDVFMKDVTHVIFKDGSFRTYQRAKLIKAHLVSLLWVEAVKTNCARVPEKNFPALGTGAFDADMSMVCQKFHDEYKEALKEECTQAVNSEFKTPRNNHKKTAIPSEILKSLGKSVPRILEESDNSMDCIPNSQDDEVESILTSNRLINTSKSVNHDCYSVCSPELTSDSSCGAMIDGEVTQNIIESLCTSSDKSADNKVMRSIENLEHLHMEKRQLKSHEKTRYTPFEMDLTDITSNDNMSNNNSSFKIITPDTDKCSLKTGEMSLLRILSNTSLNNECSKNSDRRTTDSSSATVSGLLPKTSLDSEKILTGHISNGNMHQLRNSSQKDIHESSSGNRRTDGSSATVSGLLSKSLESEKMPPLQISDEGNINGSSLQKSTQSEIMPPLRISDTSADKNISSVIEKVPSLNILDERNSLQKSAESDIMPALRISDTSADKNNCLVPETEPTLNSPRNGPKNNLDFFEANNFTKPEIREKKSRRRTNASSLISSYVEQSTINLERMHVSSYSSMCELPKSGNNLNSSLRSKTHKSISSSHKNVKTLNVPKKTNLRKTRSSVSNSSLCSKDSEDLEEPPNIQTKTNQRRTRSSVSNSSLSSLDSSKSKENFKNLHQIPEGNISIKRTLKRTRSSVSNSSLSSLQTSKESLEKSSNVQSKTNLGKTRKSIANFSLSSAQKPNNNLEKSLNTAAKKSTRRTRSSSSISIDQTNKRSLETEELPPLHVSDNSGKDKSKSSLDCTKESPLKKVKLHEELCKTPEKSQPNKNGKSSKRKLYNPNDSIGTILPLVDDEKAKKQVAKDIFKKPEGLTPILVTVRAKKFLKNKEEMTSQNTSSTYQKDQIKVPIVRKGVKGEKNKKKLENNLREKNESTFEQPETAATRTTRRQSMLSLSRQNSSSQVEENPITPIKRRSTMDFVTSQGSQSTKKSQRVIKTSGIVCTRLHRPECNKFFDIVKELGGFFVEDKVTSQTTHLVAGEPKRTINLLRAIARGCWIVKQEWLYKSLAAGKWLPEEDFELTEFSRSVQRCRIERQAFGQSYTMDIFRNAGYIYVARSSVPLCSDLQELIKLCKGKVTTSRIRARIVVGEKIDKDDVICVKEVWVLDSIEHKKMKSFKNYLYD